MKKFIYYLSRALSIIIVCFFAIFILEGFGSEFSWQDSLSHFILAFIFLIITIVSWKKPIIGSWFFVVAGLFFLFGTGSNIIIGIVPLLTGILFLIEGFILKK